MAGPRSASFKGIWIDNENSRVDVYYGSGGASDPVRSITCDGTNVVIPVNLTISSTLTAGADGVGSDGEQLTSGGAGAALDWAAAGSVRAFKNIERERTDAQATLRQLIATPVYDFHYKQKSESDERLTTTGDIETTYTGIMADDAPWAMHHHGRILNPVNTFGYTLLGLKALDERIAALESK
jgi:hypothetical protein